MIFSTGAAVQAVANEVYAEPVWARVGRLQGALAGLSGLAQEVSGQPLEVLRSYRVQSWLPAHRDAHFKPFVILYFIAV